MKHNTAMQPAWDGHVFVCTCFDSRGYGGLPPRESIESGARAELGALFVCGGRSSPFLADAYALNHIHYSWEEDCSADAASVFVALLLAG